VRELRAPLVLCFPSVLIWSQIVPWLWPGRADSIASSTACVSASMVRMTSARLGGFSGAVVSQPTAAPAAPGRRSLPRDRLPNNPDEPDVRAHAVAQPSGLLLSNRLAH
jgi:hypothetical protein